MNLAKIQFEQSEKSQKPCVYVSYGINESFNCFLQGQEIVKFMVGSEDFSEHSDLYRRMILLGMSCAVVLPLMMPRSISFLELPGIVSFLSVLYVALAVAFLYNSEKVEVSSELYVLN